MTKAMQRKSQSYLSLHPQGIPWEFRWVSHATPTEFDSGPDLQNHVNLEKRQILKPPEVRRNKEKCVYFYSLFPLPLCAVFCSTHGKRKTPLSILLCRMVPLPPRKQSCIQRRHPCTMVQGCLCWR